MNRQELEYWSRKYGLAVVLILAIIAFLLPLILRVVQSAPITPGAQSYTPLREAALLEQGIIGHDPLSGSAITPQPYVALLALMEVFGVPWLLPLLLALLFLILLHYYLERIVPVHSIVILTLAVLIVSPVMSVLATYHSGTLLALDLLLGALLLLERRPVLSYALVFLMVITLPVLGLITSLYLAVVLLRDGKHAEAIGVMLALAIASAWFLLWAGVLPYELSAVRLHTDLFFELGNSGGMTIFAVILAAYAVALKFSKLQSLIVPALLLFALTFFLPALMPLTAIALALFAGHAIFLLVTNQWELELLRESLVVLVVCIGIFLFITTIRARIEDMPNAQFSHTMTVLRNQHREGAVLTHPSYAPMVEYFSGKRATLHDAAPLQAFHSRDPGEVYPYLSATGTSYLLITEEMQGTMFTSSEQGILFLVQNSGRFVKIDENEESTLYYFIR